jgi:hypothetical protein
MAFKLWLENKQDRDRAYREIWNRTLQTLVGSESSTEAMNKSLSKLSTGDKTNPHTTYKGAKAVAKMLSPILDQMRQLGQKLGPDNESGVDLSANADAALKWLGQSDGKTPMTVGDLLKNMFGPKLMAKFTGTAIPSPEKGQPDTAKAQVPPQPPADNASQPPPPEQQPPEQQLPQDPGIPQQGPSMANSQLMPPALQQACVVHAGGIFTEWLSKRS